MIAHGHADAASYPVGFLTDEAELVQERVNGLLATTAQLNQMAVSSLFSTKSATEFKRLIEKLR